MAVRRLHTHLARALDAEGKPHPVPQAFARHLHEPLLIPSGRGCMPGGVRVAAALAGCFTYEPPTGVEEYSTSNIQWLVTPVTRFVDLYRYENEV